MATLNVNGKDLQVDADPSTPVLWALRDTLGMTGCGTGWSAGSGCGSGWRLERQRRVSSTKVLRNFATFGAATARQ